MDAYLAAFAIADGLELVAFDRDFATFTKHGLLYRQLGTKSAEVQKLKKR